MQVRCPHCRHVFATAEGGDQACPSCGARIHVPATGVSGGAEPNGGGLPPGPGNALPEPDGSGGHVRGPTPWERRGELGLWRGAWQTFRGSVLSPQDFWPSVEPRRSLSEALIWGWLLQVVAVLVGLPFLLLRWPGQLEAYREASAQMATQMKGSGPQWGAMVGQMESLGLALPILGSLLFLVLWPLLSLMGVAIMHLCAMLLGAGKNGFEATSRAFYYAQGPAVLQVIPLVQLPAQLYAWVLFGWGLKELQEVSAGRAVAVVLLPLLLVCCCLCGGFMLMGAGAAAMMGAKG